MPKFTFVCEHQNIFDGGTESKVTMEFDEIQMSEVIEQFQDFLRGCGFYFDGRIEHVEDTEETGCGGDCSSCECGTDTNVMDWTTQQLMNPPTLRGENADQG